MIIWINGAFGSGKTSAAQRLNESLSGSFVYDPENAGAFIWENLPSSLSRKGDFQDIPMWRDFNYQMLQYLSENYDGSIIVPMTLTNKQYYNEIIGRLEQNGIVIHHFILQADKPTLLSRLKSRGDDENTWAAQQIDRCAHAFSGDIKGIIINTNNLTIDETVNLITDKILPDGGICQTK